MHEAQIRVGRSPVFCRVDPDVLPLALAYNWETDGRRVYRRYRVDGRRVKQSLEFFVLNLLPLRGRSGRRRKIAHLNGDALDFRRENLKRVFGWVERDPTLRRCPWVGSCVFKRRRYRLYRPNEAWASEDLARLEAIWERALSEDWRWREFKEACDRKLGVVRERRRLVADAGYEK
jgi:hypothetical protein